jgi:hypothetical protein
VSFTGAFALASGDGATTAPAVGAVPDEEAEAGAAEDGALGATATCASAGAGAGAGGDGGACCASAGGGASAGGVNVVGGTTARAMLG